ncbi:Unknown protein, partial [Striga hermonthica]
AVAKKLGFQDHCAIVEPMGLRGGLLLLWEKGLEVINVVSREFCFQVEFIDEEGQRCWGVFVYMNVNKEIRENQWKVLQMDKLKWGSRWFIMGDWNAICKPEEKRGGIERSLGSCESFNEFIYDMGMEEVRMEGYQFTWTNNRRAEEWVEAKLDRVFGSFDWLMANPRVFSWTEEKSASDHMLLIVDTVGKAIKRGKRFQFDKRWLKREGIKEMVEKVWKENFSGTPMFIVKEKVKSTRVSLLKWSSKFKTQNQQKISELNKELEEIKLKQGWDQWEAKERLRKELNDAHEQEEVFWQQKSRNMWLREGDRNTRFFHAITAQRRRVNAITRLVDSNNRVLQSPKEILNHVAEFYNNLFSSEGVTGADSITQLITRVNLDKSAIFFSRNTPEHLQLQICAIFQGITKHSSTRYLGLPLGIGKSKVDTFKFVLDKVKARMSGWKNKWLSVAGKE